MRAIRHAWVAAVLKPDRSLGASLSRNCYSTALRKGSQGTLDPRKWNGQDAVDLETMFDVEIFTREAQVVILSPHLLLRPKHGRKSSQEPYSTPGSQPHQHPQPLSVRQCKAKQPYMLSTTHCKSVFG